MTEVAEVSSSASIEERRRALHRKAASTSSARHSTVSDLDVDDADDEVIAHEVYSTRTFHVRGGREDDDPSSSSSEFPNNHVVTSKYTVLSFVPKNLWEQFRRLANVYFLLISILQLSTDLSPTSKYATALPLTVVLLVTMVKEGMEDFRRHKDDDRINKAKARVLRRSESGRFAFETILWKDLLVGDIVRVEDHELVPADILIVSSSLDQGMCYIETSNLDGETNLKLRQAVDKTTPLRSAKDLAALSGVVKCEEPNRDLYTFEGTLEPRGGIEWDEPIPLGLNNVIWRGCQLQNTGWIAGVVLYTGQQTKLIKNSSDAPAKRSNVERVVNTCIILIFISLAIMCSVSTYLHATWLNSKHAEGAWYLTFLDEQTDWDTAATWVTFLILYNNLVPISLYVSLEIVKLAQARLIGWDAAMYHADSDTPADARTSNLNEDLGQIEYIFSDKTGTLTCNEMEFKMCSVNGIKYGDPDYDRQSNMSMSEAYQRTMLDVPLTAGRASMIRARSISNMRSQGDLMSRVAEVQLNSDDESNHMAARIGKSQTVRLGGTDDLDDSASEEEERPRRKSHKGRRVVAAKTRKATNGDKDGRPRTAFDSREFLQDLRADSEQADKIREFLTCMSVCHTVIPEKSKETGEIQYQAASPDEEALVLAARELGYNFKAKTPDALRIEQQGEFVEYQLLNVNEFHSDRKRMSVVVRCPDGRIRLYCKGADDVMIPLLRSTDDTAMIRMVQHLSDFGSAGLRTLVLASVELDEDVYASWNREFVAAKASMHDREVRLRELAARVERKMTLIGATAIEDKLQDGVPEAIETLTRAGIKVWMLTGDKLETAENIGFSCRLLKDDLDIVKVDEPSHALTAVAMARIIKRYANNLGRPCDSLALIVTGQSLTHVFKSDELRHLFLHIIKMAKVVVACRVIPSQKADIVKTVQAMSPPPLTLAIGDGANDVAMIQEAHVGVGISGNEGMQAVRASDYSFAQFRFLRRLLLVHGRWDYRRVSLLILYSFYKNIANVLTLFYYGWANGFSGTTLYESWLGAGWNVGWTFFPIIFFGIFEQDISAKVALNNPHCYVHGQRKYEFNVGRMVRWLVNAVIHSVVIYALAYSTYRTTGGDISTEGHPTGLFLMGTIINFSTMLTVNFKIALETHYWVKLTFIGLFGSALLWLAFIAVYAALLPISFDFYGVGWQVFTRAQFYLTGLLIPITAIIVDVCYDYVSKWYYPTPINIMQELQHIQNGKIAANAKSDRKRADKYGVKAARAYEWDFEKLYGGDSDPADDSSSAAETSMGAQSPARLISRELRDRDDADEPVELRQITTSQLRSIGVSSPQLVGIDGQFSLNDQLQYRVQQLRDVLAGDQDAIEHTKDLGETPVYTDMVRMHRFTQEFVDEPELEVEFKEQYTQKNIQFVRSGMGLIFLIIVAYTVYQAFSGDGRSGLRIIMTAVAGVTLLFIRTRFFRLYFQSILVVVLLAAGITRTFLVSENGTLGMSMTAIVALLVMRIRFAYAVFVVILDTIFFNIWVSANDVVDRSDLVRADFLHLAILLFASYVNRSLERSFRRDFLLQKQYERERARTNVIVDNMMPPYVNRQILQAEQEEARRASSSTKRFGHFRVSQSSMQGTMREQPLIANDEGVVSILFCDIAAFSDFLHMYAPLHLVAVLDAIYSIFDILCIRYKVQKMETVGKTYMACAGLQGTRRDHALACCEMAEEMIVIISRCQDSKGNMIPIKIGINTGEVKSGVVGLTRPQFSLFGDTVNTSSRMCSTGTAGEVNISEPTYAFVQDHYRCDEHTVFAKGKGNVSAFFLRERVTKIPPNRRFDIVQKARDMTVVAEAKKLLEQLERSHELDPYKDSKHSVMINRRTLRFVEPGEEGDYMAKHRKKAGKLGRRPLIIALLYFFGEALFEFYEEDRDKQDAYAIFFIRYGFVVLSWIFFGISYSQHYAKHAAAYSTFIFSTAMVANMAVPLIIDRQLDHQAALAYIFSLTLLSNNGTLRFINNVVANVGALLAWVVASFTLSEDGPSRLELAFFVGSATFINLIAAYGREYYYRREFVLTMQVKVENENFEGHLYKMVPKPVATALRDMHASRKGRSLIAGVHDAVSILYSDIRGFTSWSSQHTPNEVIKLLNNLFTAFDQQANKRKVYKVQTIGDAYVVVSGFRFQDDETTAEFEPQDHAHVLVMMAVDMLEQIELNQPEDGEIGMRIGIHTGKVIAGVIGTKQLRYDIWGTDPLVANKLEAEGVPGGVCISDRTRWLLEEMVDGRPYQTKFHKTVKVKGSGKVQAHMITSCATRPRFRFRATESDAPPPKPKPKPKTHADADQPPADQGYDSEEEVMQNIQWTS